MLNTAVVEIVHGWTGLDFLPTDIDLMKMLNTVVVEAVYKERLL